MSSTPSQPQPQPPSQSESSYPTLPATLLLISLKAYFSPPKTLSYLQSLLDPSNGILPLPPQLQSRLLLAFIPDFLTIYPCAQLLTSHSHYPPPSAWPLFLGAQDCHTSPALGPHTGSIVPSALSALGVSIVELGHAERRRPPLSETDDTVARKAKSVCECGMVPLICVGETGRPDLRGPMSAAVGTAMRELTPQINAVLTAVPGDAPVIVAYEPVWAIGQAQPAGVAYVGAVVQAIRGVIEGVKERTGTVRVVYGGSAGPGLWSGRTGGGEGEEGEGLGDFVDGMFLGRFAHEVGGVKKVVDEVVASLRD